MTISKYGNGDWLSATVCRWTTCWTRTLRSWWGLSPMTSTSPSSAAEHSTMSRTKPRPLASRSAKVGGPMKPWLWSFTDFERINRKSCYIKNGRDHYWLHYWSVQGSLSTCIFDSPTEPWTTELWRIQHQTIEPRKTVPRTTPPRKITPQKWSNVE